MFEEEEKILRLCLLGSSIDDGEIPCVVRPSLERFPSTPESLITEPCGEDISSSLTILSRGTVHTICLCQGT